MLTIRPVGPDESDLCRTLGGFVRAAYLALPDRVEEPDYEAELADVAVRAATPASAVLAAFAGDEPLGCLTYVSGPDSPLAEIREPGVASIRMLGVDPAAQGRGAGRALVDAALIRARADGARALALHTTQWMTTAHSLYEALGFERDRSIDWTPAPGIELRGYRIHFRV